MIFTLKEVNEFWPSFMKLANSDKMPIDVRHRFKKTVKPLIVVMRDFTESRDEAIKQYGTPQDGGVFRVTAASTAEYDRTISKMLANTTPDIEVVKLTREETDNVGLSSFDLANLEHFIE